MGGIAVPGLCRGGCAPLPPLARNADNGADPHMAMFLGNPWSRRQRARDDALVGGWARKGKHAMTKAGMGPKESAVRFVLDGKVIAVDSVEPTKSVLNFLRED